MSRTTVFSLDLDFHTVFLSYSMLIHVTIVGASFQFHSSIFIPIASSFELPLYSVFGSPVQGLECDQIGHSGIRPFVDVVLRCQ